MAEAEAELVATAALPAGAGLVAFPVRHRPAYRAIGHSVQQVLLRYNQPFDEAAA